jgi:hypothetical protein
VYPNQHYDFNTSDTSLYNLERQQHYHLGIGYGMHAEQKGQAIMAYGKLLAEL